MGQAAATLAVVSGYFTVFPGSTLTLPGIAGIILGIGMGVDANVITAERIKEELSKNKTLEGAVNSGFKMGLTPIIDGNVTIVIVAAILMGAFGPTDGFWAKVFNPIFYWFGPSTAGTIYSFGFTLLTSVLLNFVFGVWATRVMIRGAVHFKPLRKAWLFGGKKEGGADFKTPSINFIGNRKKFYTFSCALIAVVLVFCGIFGVKMDVEFKGGSMITLAYEGDADLNDLKSTIGTELGKSNLTLQTGSDISGNQTLTVTLPGSDTLTTEQLDNLLAALNEQYPDNNFVQNEVSNVDATIGKEFLLKSVVALVAACVLILLYVAYRFRKIGGLKAGSTAIVALLHDMFVVFGVFVILRIPLNGNFIAAVLTILGYSINDTVVIYDRIRENSALYGKKQMSLADTCGNDTLRDVLVDILDTPVSPELLPTAADGTIAQQTEKLVGPYELHDFYLYYVLRFGFSPTKIYHLARTAFDGRYEPEVLLAWLKNFYRRFFAQQFKRSCLPDGPKVGSVTLSPRGDWRMPSDACNTLWMAELEKLEV